MRVYFEGLLQGSFCNGSAYISDNHFWIRHSDPKIIGWFGNYLEEYTPVKLNWELCLHNKKDNKHYLYLKSKKNIKRLCSYFNIKRKKKGYVFLVDEAQYNTYSKYFKIDKIGSEYQVLITKSVLKEAVKDLNISPDNPLLGGKWID